MLIFETHQLAGRLGDGQLHLVAGGLVLIQAPAAELGSGAFLPGAVYDHPPHLHQHDDIRVDDCDATEVLHLSCKH